MYRRWLVDDACLLEAVLFRFVFFYFLGLAFVEFEYFDGDVVNFKISRKYFCLPLYEVEMTSYTSISLPFRAIMIDLENGSLAWEIERT